MNGVLFSVARASLLHPLPVSDADHLFTVERRTRSDTVSLVPSALVRSWADHSPDVTGVGTYTPTSGTVVGDSPPEFAQGAWTTSELLPLLGVSTELGRWFTPTDEQAGSAPVVVISDGLWRRQYHGDPLVLERMLSINGFRRRVVGLLPPDLMLPDRPDYWVPTGAAAAVAEVILRVRRGVSADHIESALNEQAASTSGSNSARWLVVSLRSRLAGEAGTAAEFLLAAAGMVLLIAIANVANLALTQTFERRGELALRVALGATRRNLGRELIAEQTVFAAGALIAVGLTTSLGERVLTALAPRGAIAGGLRLDTLGLAFLLVTVIAATTAIAAVPLWAARDFRARELIATYHGSLGPSGGLTRAKQGLIALQTAFGLVLASAAFLLIASSRRVSRIELGFDPNNLCIVSLTLGSEYTDAGTRRAFQTSLAARLASLPGVQGAALGPAPIIGEPGYFVIPRPIRAGAPPIHIGVRAVDPAYLETYGLKLRDGRWISSGDTAGGRPVVVLNDIAARLLRGDESPVGQQLIEYQIGRGGSPYIIGVVAAFRQRNVVVPSGPEVYVSAQQSVPSFRVTVGIRSGRHAASLAQSVQALVHDINPALAPPTVMSATALLSAQLAVRRFVVDLLSALAALAVALAGFGLYATVTDSVRRRGREIAVRRALGQSRRSLVWMVLSEVAALEALGLAAGVALSAGAGRPLARYLYGVGSHDWRAVTGAVLLVFTAGIVAGLGPALKSASTNPMEVLRNF